MVESETHERLRQDQGEDGLRIRDIEHEGAASRVVELTDWRINTALVLGPQPRKLNDIDHTQGSGEQRSILSV